MTPLLGTKTPSAPVGAKSGGDRRAARSLLSCALWRGMGGVRPPHRQHGLLGFHQPRDTQHGFPLPSGDSNESNRKPDQRVFTKHETRNTNHGFYAFLAAFPRVVERHGAAMARHGRPPSPAPATSLYDFHESRDKKHATFFPCPPATPRRATAGLPNGFSRNTRHETRITAFFPPDNESLPRDNGFLPPEYGFFRIFTVLLPHNSSQFVGIRRNSPDTDRAAVRAQSAPATRPAGFSPATGHATWFSPALRRLQREQPQARPTGFHETRDTKHESRLLRFSRCFPARCGEAWGGYGAAWAASVPRTGNTACWVFTSHWTRNMVFPCPPATPRRATASPTNGFSRNTRHETRITAFFRITSSLHAISHDFPRFPTISRHFPAPPPPSAVLARLPGARRHPQFPPPSVLVPLRPRHNEPMLRKENILDCTNSGTFYLALAIARLESPLRSRHHREQRRSGTVRGVTRSTTGRGLRRRDMPSGQETISKRR